MSERSCRKCKNLKDHECKFFPVDCWSLGLLSPELQCRMASICNRYEERAELCGAKCPNCSKTCIKPKSHKGEHGHSIGTYTNTTQYWSDPTPTAFEKAWDKYKCGHPAEYLGFEGGWQARGNAAREVFESLNFRSKVIRTAFDELDAD